VIVDLVRDDALSMPLHSPPDEVTALRIWHCKYESLSPLSSFTSLRTLVVATFPDPDLTPLSQLTGLEYLSLLHLPDVTDLTPLAALTSLVTVRLATLPSWDSSGRRTIVDSLAPLAALPTLRHVELFGVVPRDKSLTELEGSPSLLSVRVSKYDKRERERFYRATGLSDAFAPGPGVSDWQ